MKRILFITARIPYPLDDGWKIRTYYLIKGWKELGACVDLISFDSLSVPKRELKNLYGIINDIRVVPRTKSYTFNDLLKGLVTKIPFSIYNYKSPEMYQTIQDIMCKNHYDIIQIEDVVMAQYLSDDMVAIKLLDMHNIESNLLLKYAREEKQVFKKFYAWLTSIKLQKYEQKISKSFNRVITCSAEDKDILKGLNIPTTIDILPNGVDTNYFYLSPQFQSKSDIVFVGSMDYHANISGVKYFCKHILPLIWKKMKDARFIIVGKNPPFAIQKLQGPRIVVTGTVDDVRPYLEKAQVVVVPLLVGGGTRLKILEAMAMGKPIVSTTQGAEGISATHGEHIFIADEPNVFSENILRLIGKSGCGEQIGIAARKYVEANYDWNSVTSSLYNTLL